MTQDGRSRERLAGPLRLSELSAVYIDGKTPLVFVPSVVELSGYKQGERPIEVRLRIVGVEGQRAPVAGERIGVAPLTLQSAAEIVVILGAIRPQEQRSFMMGERLL